jgi:dipeptidase
MCVTKKLKPSNFSFVLKSQVALNELEPNSIDIMCSSIIDKYINHPNQYESLSLAEFNSFKTIRFQNIANPKLLGL